MTFEAEEGSDTPTAPYKRDCTNIWNEIHVQTVMDIASSFDLVPNIA